MIVSSFSSDARASLRRQSGRLLAAAMFAGLAAGAAVAQVPPTASPTPTVFYPAKEQTPKQQEQDKFECYSWAKQQSGFDPAQAGSTASAQNGAGNSAGKTAGSMAVGAAGGAAVASVTHHDAGRGAAVGALGGGLLAHKKEKQAAMAAQQQAAQQPAARAQLKTGYDRAFGACLEARGYVVR